MICLLVQLSSELLCIMVCHWPLSMCLPEIYDLRYASMNFFAGVSVLRNNKQVWVSFIKVMDVIVSYCFLGNVCNHFIFCNLEANASMYLANILLRLNKPLNFGSKGGP